MSCSHRALKYFRKRSGSLLSDTSARVYRSYPDSRNNRNNSDYRYELYSGLPVSVSLLVFARHPQWQGTIEADRKFAALRKSASATICNNYCRVGGIREHLNPGD